MILNDIWHQCNQNIQSQDNTDIDRKQSAFNMAQEYLLQRFIELDGVPDEFVSDPIALPNTYDTNYVSLPSDYLAINPHQIWRQLPNSGTLYWPLGQRAVISYDELLDRVGQNFFNPQNIAEPNNVAIKEPKMYFDYYLGNYFAPPEVITGGTSGVTANVTNQNDGSVSITGASGLFTIGETITGSVSKTLAQVTSANTQTFTITNKVFSYQVGETITGSASGAIGTITSLPDIKTVIITVTSGTFQLNETITGSISLAHSTILTMTDCTLPITVTGGLQKIKIGYIKRPTEITVYDELDYGTLTGVFQVGEIIVGGTSNAQATVVLLVGTGKLGILVNMGSFISGEVITGQISGATATTTSTLISKPATLQWGVKYKTLLIESFGLMYHRLKGSNEVESRSSVVDNMIDMMGITNSNESGQWSIA